MMAEGAEVRCVSMFQSCIFRSNPTTDSVFIRPLIPVQSTTDSDVKPSTFFIFPGMGGRIASESVDGKERNIVFGVSFNIVESLVNKGYPFLYFIEKGGRNGQKEETFHA